MDFTDYKVLPFEGSQGRVGGHEIRNFAAVKKVVFDVFDAVAGMSYQHAVHWTRWTEYNKKKWPSGARLIAVILEDGRECPAEEMYASHSDASYESAPIVCRDAISVRQLCSRAPLLEVVGAADYLRQGTPIECPWERDNKAFQARMAAA